MFLNCLPTCDHTCSDEDNESDDLLLPKEHDVLDSFLDVVADEGTVIFLDKKYDEVDTFFGDEDDDIEDILV